MTVEQIKEYLSMLTELEKTSYIEEEAMRRLNLKADSLCDISFPEKPIRHYASAEYLASIVMTGFVIAIVGAVIGTIFEIYDFWETWGIFAVLFGAFFGVGIGIVAGAIGGILIGPIVANVEKKSDQKAYDEEYYESLSIYDETTKKAKQLLEVEKRQRNFIYQQIKELEKQHSYTRETLQKFYNYNIIDKSYHFDMVAVCSFYQYFNKEMTFSLGFDRATGDRGAYNIYEEEKRLGRIESKLDVVIDKLDQMLENQSYIKYQLGQANEKIYELVSGVNSMSKKLNDVNDSIKEQTAIEQYNAECIQNQINFRNTMDIIYRWH
ncbi:MAG: hypothetical protein IKB73_03865 [Ruminococcus sp.]|nr:hypothetical protein [Ruminococcus sp.]